MNSSKRGTHTQAGTCCCCGGSGVLRTEAAAYRTCLECLGQGQSPVFEAVFGLPDPVVLRPQVSASTSGAR